MDDTSTNERRKTCCQWGHTCMENCKGCDCYYDPNAFMLGKRDDRDEFIADYFRMMEEEYDG